MISAESLAAQKGIGFGMTDLQKLAARLVVLFVVVILIALVVAGFAAYLAFPTPPTVGLPANATVEQISAHNKEVWDLYKQQQELQAARFATIGTTVVSTIFLPSLTLVLGYLFGKS